MSINIPTLTDIEDLARQAGEILRAAYNPRPGYGTALEIGYKGEIDLVTEIDRRSEAFLLESIRRRFPTDSILTEESGDQAGNSERRWFIDPLDGTTNFAHGMPFFSVSLAYALEGVILLGVVYDPVCDECFSAERGKGAWLNGEPLRVSGTRLLQHSLLATGLPYDVRTNPNNNLPEFARFSMLTQAVRRLGSASLQTCYVAAGRLDGFWEKRVYAWDVAAAGLIASEAGARVTGVHGAADYLKPPQSILAANPLIHTLMLEILNED